MSNAAPPLDPLALLDDLISRALAAGADAADGVMFESASLSVSQRLGVSEGIERAESQDVGLRVFRGKRQAMVSSTDMGGRALTKVIERALAMASAAPEDPYCGLAETGLLAVAKARRGVLGAEACLVSGVITKDSPAFSGSLSIA